MADSNHGREDIRMPIPNPARELCRAVANTIKADLPPQAQTYVRFVEEYTGVPVKWIGTGRT